MSETVEGFPATVVSPDGSGFVSIGGIRGAILRFLPGWAVEKIRARFRGNARAKDFLMMDRRSDIREVSAETSGWRHVPMTTSLQYVGRKVREVQTWTWPSQGVYPRASA